MRIRVRDGHGDAIVDTDELRRWSEWGRREADRIEAAVNARRRREAEAKRAEADRQLDLFGKRAG